MDQEDLPACSADRLEKICVNFNLLTQEQQDYILGIMQALVFANNDKRDTANEPEDDETPSGL